MTNYYQSNSPLSKGIIVLMNHGLDGDEDTFKNTANVINARWGVLGAKIYTDNHLTQSTGLDSPIYKDLEANAALYRDKMIFIRTKFQRPLFGTLQEQATEVNDIINKIRGCLISHIGDYKFILFGHSKGGLVNMRFILNNLPATRSYLKGMVSINTPYNGPRALYYTPWTLLDETIYTQITETGNQWSNTSNLSLPKLVCIATNEDYSGMDNAVTNDSALGYPANPIHSTFGKRTYKNIFRRKLLSGYGNKYSHAGCLGNDTVIYTMLLSIQEILSDSNTGSGGTYY